MLNKRFIFLASVVAFFLLAGAIYNIGVLPEWSEGVLHPINVLSEEKTHSVGQDGATQAQVEDAINGSVVKPAVPTVVKGTTPKPKETKAGEYDNIPDEELAGHRLVDNYFEQVFSAEKPDPLNLDALERLCARTEWTEGEVYLKCGAFSAGLTSIMSELKVCLKMAAEAGVSLILPVMPLRSSDNLKTFNFLNPEAYMGYEEWFDAEHLIERLPQACPKMKVVYPSQLDLTQSGDPEKIPVKYNWNIDISKAPGYHLFNSYFWVGRPFKTFFNKALADLEVNAFINQDPNNDKTGVTVVELASYFLLFRVMDDPTREDLKVWNDLAHLNRFRPPIRSLVHQVLGKMNRPHYAVHFRAENDTIWSSPEHQMEVDLQGLDDAWKKFGSKQEGAEKPLVYLACGDQAQIAMFEKAAEEKGWEVTHKYKLLKEDSGHYEALLSLPFDFQGGVDFGVMLKGEFFMGVGGSAFSSTVANMRDPSGRYRGSSLTWPNDEGARNHLFNDGDAAQYPCCL